MKNDNWMWQQERQVKRRGGGGWNWKPEGTVG